MKHIKGFITGLLVAIATTAFAVNMTGPYTFTDPVTFQQGVAGKTDGSSAGAGEVGEVFSSVTAGDTTNIGGSFVTIETLNLSAGTWLIMGQCHFNLYATSSTNAYCFVQTDGAAEATPSNRTNSGNNSGTEVSVPPIFYSKSSGFTVTLQGRYPSAGATDGTARGALQAMRIR